MEEIMMELKILIDDIEKNILSRIRNENIRTHIEMKGLGNFVTSYDKEIESFLKEKLTKIIPGSSFIGEETGIQEGEDSTYTWIVDPIDGTSNFIRQLPFAISIGLVKNSRTELGIVYDATTNELYSAIRGRGAFLNEKMILASISNTIENSIFIYGYPYDITKTRDIVKKSLIVKEEGAADLKRIGPASLDVCKVARGQVEGYFEMDLQPWDVAAAILILEEARGRIIKMNGMPYDYKKAGIIATNQSEEMQTKLFNLVGDPIVLDIER